MRVLAVGDCMLDAYVSGSASRISPEAPVPVVEVCRRGYVAGGAANVAANVRSLGAMVSLAGVIGSDESGGRLRGELERRGIGIETLVEDPSRVTTTKTRVTAGGQQIVRFDEEDRAPLPAAVADELRARCAVALDSADVCVISDYAKGVIDDHLCGWLIREAERRGLPVVVDPKSRDLSRYRGATLITPNLKEAAAAAEPLQAPLDLAGVARLLLRVIAPSALLVTQGEGGMSLFEQDKPVWHLPALVNEVADVTGAGDTVVAALAIALGMRLSLYEAAKIANIAAGVAVSHHGTWAVKADELLAYAETAKVAQP
ncbi:MAG: PfkB family carbohydrate kinase [Acidobacteriota bacterium]